MWTPRAIYSLFFIFLLAIALPVSSAGSTLYVAPSGSDGNPCSPNLPCREIRRALQLVVAGDTILVADGSYKGFDIRDLRGEAGKPITIKAQGTNAVIQKTTDRSDNRDTIFITFSSHIVVDGLRSFNANRAALRVDQSPKVVIRNGVFGNNATWGIFTDFSDDLLIENNETYGSIAEHGIYVSNSGDRPVVRGNRSHDNRGCGIHMNADVNSGGDGIIVGALIENNIIYNNGVGGGAGINMDGVQDSVVRNNVLYNNYATGIALFQSDGAEGPKGNRVYHNTVHQASNGRWALLIWRAWGNNTLRNNVLYHPSPARGGINFLSNADVVATDSDYNVLDRITPDDAGTVHTLAQWKLQGHETHSLSATPTSLFVNAAGGDFHLAASSPAIDRGLTLIDVTKDRDGIQRPRGAASDIGAYEAGGVPMPSLTLTPPSLAFGSVNVGASKDLTVTLKNPGNSTITGSASTSAPFAVVGAASYSLGANQSAVLTVRFSPTAAGAASRTLSLTNGGSVPLSGTGVATPPVLSVTPASLAFGSVNVGSSKNLTVTVKNVGGGTLTGSASTSAPFTVVAPASYSLAANQSAVLKVRFSPTAAGAVVRNLSFTGGKGASGSVSGTGVATPPVLSVITTSLAFGSVNVGSSKDLTVTVKNVGGGTLIGSASTSAPFTVVAPASYSLAANQSAVLKVRFSPTAAGAVVRNLSFTGGKGASGSVSGTGVAIAPVPVPVVAVTPASLAFGSVNVGSSKNLTVTVKNAGGGTLIGSASTSAPFTVVAPASYSLAANQSAVLTVRFSPTAVGAVTRNLSFSGGGGASGSVSGTGVATNPTPAQTLKILDSYERVEYASATDFKDSAAVKLSMGEPVGYVVKLANDTQMPSGNFTRLYKMVPINITTPSYSGGKTGLFYDALVPLLPENLAGTTYVYAEYVAPRSSGSYLVSLFQGRESITLNATVVNNTLTPNRVPLQIAVINSFLTWGHYGKYVGGSESLGIPYLREAIAHRITPYGSLVFQPPVVSGMIDYSAGGSYSFQKNVLDFVPQNFMMPNFSDPAGLQAAEATVRAKGQSAWFYTRDEPGASEVAATNALIAKQKQYAPSIRTMVTTSATSGITPDIYCPVIDHFAVQTYPGGPIMPGEAAYAGKELWLYTSCMEHGCGANRAGNIAAAKVSGNSTGAPGFSLDRPAAYVYAFIAMPLRYKSLKGLLYYNSVEQYKFYSKGVDVWTDQFNFGGNGDGTLFYPLRAGMYGSNVDQPAVSIRMKKIRDAEYLMDYAAQGSAFVQECGAGSLIKDSLNWEKNASAYRAFRECLISKLGF